MIRRLWNLLRRSELDAGLDVEMRHHLELLEAEHRDNGLSPEEARRAARRDFGSPTLTREKYREQLGLPWLEIAWRDLRSAIRSMRRAPVLTLAIIATLALGIGANTAIFSVVRIVLLKPLPFADPERLVWITEYDPGNENESVPFQQARDWPDRLQSFESLAFFGQRVETLSYNSSVAWTHVVYASIPISKLLGVQPVLGRDFLPEELTLPLSKPVRAVALISDRLFRRFGSDPGILGQTVTLSIIPHTIVGVLPAGFHLPLPNREIPQADPDIIVNSGFSQHLIGRLKKGVSLAAARAELNSVREDRRRELRMITLHERVVGSVKREILVLWFTVGCVLLIACVNVANLLLARSTIRTREMAVRSVLGAGRPALLRQILIETTALSFLGGVLGFLLASGAVQFFAEYGPAGMTRLRDVRLDWTVVLYCAACCLATGMASGLPLGLGLHGSLVEALRSSGEETSSASVSARLWHGSLVVAQLALALIVVTGAGLLLKSLAQIRSASSEARPDQVLIADLRPIDPIHTVGSGLQQDRTALQERLDQILKEIRAIPGVTAAGVEFPINTIGRGTIVEGLALSNQASFSINGAFTSEGYFAAAGYRLIAGRLFNQSDSQSRFMDAVVNESFLRMFAPGLSAAEAVNRDIFVEVQGKRHSQGRIVGVVNNLNVRRNAVPEPLIFRPLIKSNLGFGFGSSILVRTSGDPMAFEGRIRRIAELNRLRVVNAESFEDRIIAAVATRTFESYLLTGFAGLALLLALIGIYGVLNYAVSQRTREIGIRMALGASPGIVLRSTLAGGLRLSLIGISAGLLGAFLITRWMRSMLFGVTPFDPLTYAAAAALMLSAAAIAAYLPARRATRINPKRALAHE